MPDFAEPLERLIQEFKRLPASARNQHSASRFTSSAPIARSAERLRSRCSTSKIKLGLCAQCNNISDSELCPFCRDPHRDHSVICVVEEPHNILPIETTRQFSGLYHVLHGSISPLRGSGRRS